jgi:hypothetical protein
MLKDIQRRIMSGRVFPAAVAVLLLFGCSSNDDPVDTTDYSAALYGKWQVTSGGNGLKYINLQQERRMYLLGEDASGFRGVVSGAFSADATILSLGGRTFLYARTTDQLGLINSADTINLIRNVNGPEYTQWMRQVTPSDSIPAPVNQASDIGSDSTHLWMGSGLSGTAVLYRITIATKAVASITPPLLVTAAEWTGTSLWCGAAFTTTLGRIDTGTGGLLSTSIGIGSNIGGLAWNGQYLWAGSQTTRTLHVYDPQTNSVVQTFPGIYGDGMAFAGGFLYLCKDGSIHKCIPSPFRAVTSYSIPGARAAGIAFDGTYFWVSATTGTGTQYTIYRVTL